MCLSMVDGVYLRSVCQSPVAYAGFSKRDAQARSQEFGKGDKNQSKTILIPKW